MNCITIPISQRPYTTSCVRWSCVCWHWYTVIFYMSICILTLLGDHWYMNMCIWTCLYEHLCMDIVIWTFLYGHCSYGHLYTCMLYMRIFICAFLYEHFCIRIFKRVLLNVHCYMNMFMFVLLYELFSTCVLEWVCAYEHGMDEHIYMYVCIRVCLHVHC